MAEDPIQDSIDARSSWSGARSQSVVGVHVSPQVPLADAAARISPKPGVNGRDEISALRLAVPIVRRWPVILTSAVILGAVAVALTFVIPARYTARTSFTVEAGSNSVSLPKGLGAIAGQLGVVFGSSGTGAPPAEYFTALATSWTIRAALLASRYTSDGKLSGSDSGTALLELLNVKGGTPARRVENGVEQLGRMIGTVIDRKAGLVTLTVADRDPQRAAAIGNRLIELLNKYNVEQRQSRSRQERELAQRSLSEAQRELRAAEEQLQDFLSRNRRYQHPLLLFQENRLQRAVVQKQEVATGLAQAYEEARIAEAGDIPVISLIDAAVPPTRRSFPIRWQFLLGGVLLGGLAGLLLAYLLEARRTWIAEQQPDFVALRDAARAWKTRLGGRHVRA